MSKLAHSNDETMAQIERDAENSPDAPWECLNCGDRRFVLKPSALENFASGARETMACPECNAGGKFPHPAIYITTPS